MMDDKKKVVISDDELDNVTGGAGGFEPTPCQIADSQLGVDDFSNPVSYQGE